MSLLNEAEEMVEEAAEEIDPVPNSSPPLTRFFSRYPIETQKSGQKPTEKPQLSRFAFLSILEVEKYN